MQNSDSFSRALWWRTGRQALSVALILGIIATFPGISHATEEEDCPGAHKKTKNWTGIDLPEVTPPWNRGEIEIDPSNPRRIFVHMASSQGGLAPHDAIFASLDGGCSWKTVFDTEDLDHLLDPLNILPITRGHIKQIIAASDEGRERLYVVMESDNLYTGGLFLAPGAPKLARGHLFMSRDNGKTWEVPQEGLGLSALGQGDRFEVRVAPWDPDVLYAAMFNSLGTFLADPDVPPSWFSFFKSTNGGRTWSELSQPISLDNPTARRPGWTMFGYPIGAGTSVRIRFEVDPVDKDVLWAIFDGTSHQSGVWRSADGGASWTQATSPSVFPASSNPEAGQFRPISIQVDHRPGELATILLREGGGGGLDTRRSMILSDDGGRTWSYVPELPSAVNPITGETIYVEAGWIEWTGGDRFSFLGNDGNIYRLTPSTNMRWAQLRHPFAVQNSPNYEGWNSSDGTWSWASMHIVESGRRPALYLYESPPPSKLSSDGMYWVQEGTIWRYKGRW